MERYISSLFSAIASALPLLRELGSLPCFNDNSMNFSNSYCLSMFPINFIKSLRFKEAKSLFLNLNVSENKNKPRIGPDVRRANS